MIKRNKYASIRLSGEENQKIREQAASLCLNVSEFIRRRAMEKQIVPERDLQRLEELRQLGRNLKNSLLETQETYNQDTADAIHTIENYVRELEGNFSR